MNNSASVAHIPRETVVIDFNLTAILDTTRDSFPSGALSFGNRSTYVKVIAGNKHGHGA